MLTEVQLYMSTSCQPGSGEMLALSDVEKPFLSPAEGGEI